MSLLSSSFKTGILSGVVYTFEHVGDILEMHTHGPLDVHITIVARGRVRVHGPEYGDKEYSAGAVIDWDVGIAHEFIGLEDNSRIVNIIKGVAA